MVDMSAIAIMTAGMAVANLGGAAMLFAVAVSGRARWIAFVAGAVLNCASLLILRTC